MIIAGVLSLALIAAPTTPASGGEAGQPAQSKYTLPPESSWIHGHCSRRNCTEYQYHAFRDGTYLTKHRTLYAPRFLVEVGFSGASARAGLTHAPFSLCESTHGDECSMEVKVGTETKTFGFGGRGEMEIVAIERFVKFAGDSKSFEVAYLDEHRKRVVIRFDAQVLELRPARLDR